MITLQGSPNSGHLTKGQQKKNQPFDTEISQQAQSHHEDKGFSPWIREKTIIQHQISPQQLDYHRFLATIRLSPRHRGKFRKQENNMEEIDNLQTLKADLTSKIKAEKIGKCQVYDEKVKSRSTQSKNFFQRRANLAKLYRRPKSIDLSLQFDPKNILKCSPLSNSPQFLAQVEQSFQNGRNEQRIIHKLRKKKQSSQEQKKFSTTLKDFRVNIVNTQKKVYQTLQLNIDTSQKLKKPEHDQPSKTLTIFNRPKFIKPKQQKNTIQLELGDTLACLGKNAIVSFGHRTCREKFKQHKIGGKNGDNQIFMA